MMTDSDEPDPGREADAADQEPPFVVEEAATLVDVSPSAALLAGAGAEPSAEAAQITPLGTPAGASATPGRSSLDSDQGEDTGAAAGVVEQVQQAASQAAAATKAAAAQVGEQVAARVGSAMDAVAPVLANAVGAASARTASVAGQAPSGAAQQAGAAAPPRLEDAARWLRQPSPIAADLEGIIRRRPVGAVLVAAGAGFLLARAVR